MQHSEADDRPEASGPLDGVRVLDLTSVIMGPLATRMLGDLGADVICIENRAGDTNRYMGRGPLPGMSGTALNLMRNKRSVGLDLKHPDGRAACLKLAEASDVVVTNLRPGPLGRLGLAYDDVRQVRPDVVFCQAHGYPSDSPKANAPAYDDIIQSASGIGDLYTRLGQRPALLPTLVADKVAGQQIAAAVLAALYHRAMTGEGQHIEVPMVDVMREFVLVEHGANAIAEPPQGEPGYERILTPERRPQQTADGWINVLPYSDAHYWSLFAAGNRDDLLDDPRIDGRAARIANSDSLYRDVAEILRGRSTADWLEFCQAEGIPATPARTLDELIDELPLAEHPSAGNYRQIPHGVRYEKTPATVRRHAPAMGENGREVLAEVGYDDAQLDALEAAGVLFQSEHRP